MPAPISFTPFRPEDFRLYEPRNRSDDSLNARRLQVRHKLQAIGDAAKAALAKDGLALERRESLHHPFSVNHMRVVAQWTALFRDAKARRAFARAVGPDLGKDVDPGHANAAFFVSIDELGLQLGLRLGAEAWYDAQNLVQRCGSDDAGQRALAELLRAAPGFHLRLHDWATLHATDAIGRDQLLEVFRYFEIGKHQLRCYRTIGKDDPRACDAAFVDEAVAALRSLAPLYRFVAWSPDNDRLLRRDGSGFLPA